MLIIAHRGARGGFIEGSKAAYQEAINQNADGLECDLRLTKDNFIICHHDGNTMRVFKIDMGIAQSSLTTLKQKVEIYLFEDLLNLALANKKVLVIEFKHPVPTGGKVELLTRNLLKAYENKIKKNNLKIILISFSYFSVLRNLFLGNGLYKTGLIISNKFFTILNPTKIGVIHVNFLRKNPYISSMYKKWDKKLYVWDVNTISDFELCKDLQVEAVISDYPKKIRDISKQIKHL